jgi:hypothetical protein
VDLRIFLDKLRALEEMLSTRTTLFLSPKIEPVDLFLLDGGAQAQPATGQTTEDDANAKTLEAARISERSGSE